MKNALRLLALTTLALTPTAVDGQSVFNSAGLGRQVEAIDGRSRALGSVGIGLRGGSISPVDPAAAAGLGFASAVMVAQPSWVEMSQDGVPAGDFTGTRFPLLGIAYPLLGGMGTIHFASVLDQGFSSERVVSVDLGGTSYDVMDNFLQEGGVSNASLGFARSIGSSLAVGVALGRYTGSVTRTLTRDFGDLDLEGAEPFGTQGRWGYAGTSVTAGASTDIRDVVHIAGSVRWSSALEAKATSGAPGGDRSYDLPLELRIGASAVLAPGLLVVASAVQADWSDMQDDFTTTVPVGDASGYGVGLELSRVRFLGRSAPLRVGYRRTGLPFGAGNDDSGYERVFTGGLGFALNETNGVTLAGVDIGIERGERISGSFTEQFWRATGTIRVAGF